MMQYTMNNNFLRYFDVQNVNFLKYNIFQWHLLKYFGLSQRWGEKTEKNEMLIKVFQTETT